jgi:hypothetical protein
MDGDAHDGRKPENYESRINQPAHVFTISLFSCACPVMVAGVFVYAEQPVIGMGSS